MPDYKRTEDRDEAAYEHFLREFAACGTAKEASAVVFPNVSWCAAYKRLKKRFPHLYNRYLQIASDSGFTQIRNRIEAPTDAYQQAFDLIAQGSTVVAAFKRAMPDRKLLSIIAEMAAWSDERRACYEAAKERREIRWKNDPARIERKRAQWRAAAKHRKDPAKRTATQREYHHRRRKHASWRQREKMMRLAIQQAREEGVPAAVIRERWGVPTVEEWRLSLMDYSEHNVQE